MRRLLAAVVAFLDAEGRYEQTRARSERLIGMLDDNPEGEGR